MSFNLKQYEANEDINYHSENYLQLAMKFGTVDQVKTVCQILERNALRGYTSQDDSRWMYDNINHYYRELIS